MQQKQIWNSFWKDYENNLKDEIEIKEYHTDLKRIIEQYSDKNDIIEMGCGTGITSLILDERFTKTVLDYDKNILDFTRQLFEGKNQNAVFINANLFNNSLSDKSYDIVFNSGLMEHYDAETRVFAFKEFKRILKDDGRIIIAIPNHYCIPYRLGYLLLSLLKKWPYPKEHKIKKFDKELELLNLNTEKVIICSKNILRNSIKNKVFRKIYTIIDKIFKFEGYLRVLIIKKCL